MSDDEQRIRRPNTAYKGRAGDEAAEADARRAAADAREAEIRALNVSIGKTMATARQVITENIEEIRDATGRFREGQYRAKEIPDDVRVVAANLIKLARQVSETSLDLCEQLVKTTLTPPSDTMKRKPAPPFRAPPALRVTVRFDVDGKAVAHTTTLPRPQSAATKGDIAVHDLRPVAGDAQPIGGVTVADDISDRGGIVVSVPVAKAAPGIYSGLVFVGDEKVPLGLLTIEVKA